MKGREAVFANIRKSLRVSLDDRLRREQVAARLQQHPRNLIPSRGQKPEAARLELFTQMLEMAKASFTILHRREDIPAEVAAYLRSRNLPHAIRHGAILGALSQVQPGAAMVLIAPHDPVPLLNQIAAGFDDVTVSYLVQGPEEWQLLLARG